MTKEEIVSSLCPPGSPPEVVDETIRTFLHTPELFEWYNAPECSFDAVSGVIERASGEALFPDGEKNTRFLKFKTIKAARLATAFVVGDKILKFSQVSKCTHLLESAAIATNLRHTLPHLRNNAFTEEQAKEQNLLPAYKFMQDKTLTDEQLREIIAFASYVHDHLEDFQKDNPFITADYLVKNCWTPFCLPGNEKHADFVVYLVNALTDPQESRKWPTHKRLQYQLEKALKDPTGLVGLIRYAEKYAMLARDIDAYERNPSLKLAKKIRKNSKRRRHFMRQYPIAKIISRYEDAIEYLEKMIPSVQEMKARRNWRKKNANPQGRGFRALIRNFGGNIAAARL
ncbi:MAG: hypothetical protein AB7E52_04845 [Bdellovibrionales bacterium]